jgi:Tfp pilus assembly protein PilE
MSGMIGLLTVLAIGYYTYSTQIRQLTNGRPVAQQINLAAVKSDLLSIAQSERYYLATNGSFATLEQLRESGNVSSIPENRRGYVYVAEVTGVAHFRIIAKPADSSRTDLPTLSIDETMQISP